VIAGRTSSIGRASTLGPVCRTTWRIDFRERMPSLVLGELTDGEYRPVVTAAAEQIFSTSEPFEFAIEPEALLDEKA
jgi:hypothetical protein